MKLHFAKSAYPNYPVSLIPAENTIVYPAEDVFKDMTVECMVALLDGFEGNLVIVGHEIGSGVVPVSPDSRYHCDHIGRAYQEIGKRADRITRCFAGICRDF